MKSSTCWTLTILLLLCLSCSQQNHGPKIVENPTYGKWQERQNPVRFELTQRFGSPNADKGMLLSNTYNLIGPVADSLGNIYLIDNNQSKLLSYDPKGNLRWVTGEEGRGPGDLLRPKGLAIRDGYLYLDNVSGSRIDKYDLNGNFIWSRMLPSDIKFTVVKGFLSNGLLATNSPWLGKMGNRISFFEVSDSLKLINSFKVHLLKDVDTGGGVGAKANVSVIDSLVAIGNYRDYSFAFYNVRGQKVRSVSRDFDKMVRPGIVKSAGQMRTLGSLKAPLKLANGNLLTTLYWPTNIQDPDEYTRKAIAGNPPPVGFANSMDLFSKDGTLLYSWERDMLARPKIGRVSYVDGDGNLYTKVDEPFPQIHRYKVNFESK